VENVADLLHRGLGTVLGDLAASGYDAEWRCIPASVVGLPQTRDRMWIVAYPRRGGLTPGDERKPAISEYFRWADDDRLGEAQLAAQACAARAWRSDDGIPGWVDRIHSTAESARKCLSRLSPVTPWLGCAFARSARYSASRKTTLLRDATGNGFPSPTSKQAASVFCWMASNDVRKLSEQRQRLY